LSNVENKQNVILDFCFNTSEHIEQIDDELTSKQELIDKFKKNIERLQSELNMPYLKYYIRSTDDGFYYHADYRRDLNYNFCKKVDYVMWGETDSFFPKEAFQVIESLSKYTDEQNIHRYLLSFSDRKMWDETWNPLVHPKFENHVFIDDEFGHLNPNQAKSPMSIEKMNEINAESNEFDFSYLTHPKISGACLVLSSDLIKYGVNIPSCLIYNDDHGLSIMAQKLCGKGYLQFVCKNILHVHARRHPKKRLYIRSESNPHSFADDKNTMFQNFKKLSEYNISVLVHGKGKFYEYQDFEKTKNK